jgi:glycosyltransferase involved in cell wall biosynthesis
MGNIKLTAIVPTGNEEINIDGVLSGLDFADELLVVDSFSEDKTVELAKKYTDKILQREYGYSASQKNWAIPQASHEWILLVDADERVTPELKEEIIATINSNPEEVAFWIGRSNDFMGKRLRYSGWQGDKVIRLFKRDACRYEDKQVHAEIITDGKVGELKHKLLHNTYKGLDHHVKKLNRYAEWQSNDYLDKTKRLGFYHFFIKPAFRFYKHYIRGLGFLDGVPGLVVSALASYAVFMRYVKIWLKKRDFN